MLIFSNQYRAGFRFQTLKCDGSVTAARKAGEDDHLVEIRQFHAGNHRLAVVQKKVDGKF